MKTPWDIARKKTLTRRDSLSNEKITLEPGVNFFVEELERAGAKVKFTCEGHPTGFGIVFDAGYDLALAIKQRYFFNIELLCNKQRWIMTLQGSELSIANEKGKFSVFDRNRILRAASRVWGEISPISVVYSLNVKIARGQEVGKMKWYEFVEESSAIPDDVFEGLMNGAHKGLTG